MIRYVPFLKAKRNEIKAISELTAKVATAIHPFFDFPRKMDGYDEAGFAGAVARAVSSLKRNLPADCVFYLDNFDIEDALRVNGEHNYAYLLESASGMQVIPVIGVDRSAAHLAAVISLKRTRVVKSEVVAFRIGLEEFEEFAVTEDDIATDAAPVFREFEAIDLVFDCRVCADLDPDAIGKKIRDFSRKFCAVYKVRQVIVTGSSIPASISEIVKVDAERTLKRNELEIFAAVKVAHGHAPLVLGDYATVSPNYSDLDIPAEVMQNVMTAKLTYTLKGAHYFIRGGGMRTNGAGQYFRLARTLCRKSFFRGRGYSTGDTYFEQKSRSQGPNCAPNTVIKPAVVAHISYMVLDATV